MIELVRDLLKMEADLVVTVTAPLDRRRPGNDKDRIQLRNLVSEAVHRVRDEYSGDGAQALMDGLEKAASELELSGADGAVIVATTEMAMGEVVHFPVQDSVTLATTPATRYLIQGLRRSPRYRVLVLSDNATRLFDAIRDDLVEVRSHGFPFEADIVPRDRRATGGRFALAPGGDDKELWRNFYREVDQGLTEASRGDELPLFVVGVKNTTVLFEEISRNEKLIVGHVEGSHEHTSAHDLGKTIWQLMRQSLRDRREEAISELAERVGTAQAVTGIDEVWRLAREGRGRLLVVEENYKAESSREVDGRLVRAEGTISDGVMEDPVDELIEHIVRAGGAVEFVAADALSDYARVGLILR